MSIEERIQKLEKDYSELWKWASGLASLVQCLVEDRLDDENLSEAEKKQYCKLLKEI